MEIVIQRSLDARAHFAQQVEAASLRRKELSVQATSPMSSPPGSPTFIEEQQHNSVGAAASQLSGTHLYPGHKSQVDSECLTPVDGKCVFFHNSAREHHATWRMESSPSVCMHTTATEHSLPKLPVYSDHRHLLVPWRHDFVLKVLAHFDSQHARRMAAQQLSMPQESAGAVDAVKFDASGKVIRAQAISRQNAKTLLASHPILCLTPP